MDGKKIILGAILILALVPNLEAGRSECWLDGHSCRTLYPPAEDIFYGCCPGLICIPTGGPDFEGECSPACRDVLGVMSGCLSIIYCDEFSDVMHILEPPAIVKSIDLPDELNLDEVSEMIGFTKTGKFFVTGPLGYKATGFNRTLGIVDTNTRPMKYTMLLRFHEVIEISRYVPTLISPFPIEEPSEG